MSPQEKALEIFMKYAPDLINELGMGDYVHAINKKFALIAVDEIINLYTYDDVVLDWKYWQEVKQEINKL